MKQQKSFLGLRIFLCGCAALGWWGFLYPELTMTPSTYQIVDEQGEKVVSEEQKEGQQEAAVYWEILYADREQIRFRSKLYSRWLSWQGR